MKNARGHASQRREVSFFTLYARLVPGTWAAEVGCARDADAATSGMDSWRMAATSPWLDPSCSLVRVEQPGGARCSIVCAPPPVGPENFTRNSYQECCSSCTKSLVGLRSSRARQPSQYHRTFFGHLNSCPACPVQPFLEFLSGSHARTDQVCEVSRPTPANREIVFHSGNGNCTIVFQLCFTT